MKNQRVLTAAALAAASMSAFADFNDNKPITATVTGATPSGYPRTIASFAMQGFLGVRSIPWQLRLVLIACAVATVSPRFDVRLAATLLGASALALVRLRRAPAKLDVSD